MNHSQYLKIEVDNMFSHLCDQDREAIYNRYRNNIDLLKEERPKVYSLYEYHLQYRPIIDTFNQFNNWLHGLLLGDTEQYLE